MNTQIVILGAGFAGMMAAQRLARKLPQDRATITLINASDAFIERTRLHQVAAGQHPKAYPIHKMLSPRARFVHGRATAIRPNQKQVMIETASGTQSRAYDFLIYALGSRTDRARIPGLEHVFTLDASDSTGLSAALKRAAATGGRVLVIGGGLTGMEAATEVAESFPSLRVALATRGALGDDLSPAGAAYVRAVFARHAIAIHDNTAIARIEPGCAVTATGERLPFDVCINCAGLVAPALVREAGLAVNASGQLVTDAFMRSVSHPEVYGAGDAAVFEDAADMPLRMACATAIPMGAHVAENVAAAVLGKPQQPFAFGYVLRCISLGRKDALVQPVSTDDAPKPRVVTGRRAVWTKEAILRGVMLTFALEKRFDIYRGSLAHTAVTQSPTPDLSLAAET
jgi:NADH dehydrogenase FAD-containing subunit